jgi:hypothetical protein
MVVAIPSVSVTPFSLRAFGGTVQMGALNEDLQICCVSDKNRYCAVMTVNSCVIGNRYFNDKPFCCPKGPLY